VDIPPPLASTTEPPSVYRMNARNLLIPLLCIGAVAFACGPRSHSEASLVTASVVKAEAPTKKKRAQQNVTKVTGSFAVRVEPHALAFDLAVTNAGKKNVELAFPDGQTHDFTVIDSTGREVYRWGRGRMFTQSLQYKELDGGDTLHVAERALAELPRGDYVAVATLRSTNYPVTERFAFQLR
jgi:hypothetical protein